MSSSLKPLPFAKDLERREDEIVHNLLQNLDSDQLRLVFDTPEFDFSGHIAGCENCSQKTVHALRQQKPLERRTAERTVTAMTPYLLEFLALKIEELNRNYRLKLPGN